MSSSPHSADTLAERLERGELVTFMPCPFPPPADAERAFLFTQRLQASFHKNISYDPVGQSLTGGVVEAPAQAQRLQRILADFSAQATAWLADLLPRYVPGCTPDRATLRSEEEATRRLRPTARNDLLHLDAFPSRPTQGRRILRLFVNLHPTDARIWATSETFDQLLARYGALAGLPSPWEDGWVGRVSQQVVRLFHPQQPRRTAYDRFMLRFHHFLKLHEPFQERAPKKLWQFPPGSAWLFFSDMLSHAELRGRYALEHSFFIDPQCLALPAFAPAHLLEAHVASAAAA